MPNPPEVPKALVTARAFIGGEPMKDSAGQFIQESTECSTDIPQDALGEATVLALNRAWKTGIDPAKTEGFHLRITFS